VHKAFDGSFPAEFGCQCACVKSGDTGNIVFFEKLRERFFRAPVARFIVFVNDEAVQEEPARFHIGGVDAVTADFRISHGNELPGVGGIAQYFLISAQACIEDDLADLIDGCPDGISLHHSAVGKSQKCFFLTFFAPVVVDLIHKCFPQRLVPVRYKSA